MNNQTTLKEAHLALSTLGNYVKAGVTSLSVLVAVEWLRLAEELRRLGTSAGPTKGPGQITQPPDRALLNRVAVELHWGAEELKARRGMLVRDAYRAAALERLAGELAGWLERHNPSTM